jgi:hypothetical protein
MGLMVVGDVDVDGDEAGEWAVTCVLSSPYLSPSTDTQIPLIGHRDNSG